MHLASRLHTSKKLGLELMCTCEATYSGSSTTLATITYPSPSATLLLPRSQWKQRSRPLPPLPHEQDMAFGWARPYSSASSSKRPPSPTAASRAASLVTSSCKKYTMNRQTVSEVHFHSNRSLKLIEIHTSNEVTKILKSTTCPSSRSHMLCR